MMTMNNLVLVLPEFVSCDNSGQKRWILVKLMDIILSIIAKRVAFGSSVRMCASAIKILRLPKPSCEKTYFSPKGLTHCVLLADGRFERISSFIAMLYKCCT